MDFLMNRHDDFTNRELVCDMDDNSSVSSLGSTSSEDDESDAESISSEEESPACFLQRRRNSKAKKDQLSRHKMNRLRHNLTAPDFKMPQVGGGNKSTAHANARWGVKETTRTLSHMSFTPPGSKKNLRKSSSVDLSEVGCGNNRWTATRCSKKTRPKITNEILTFTTCDKSTAAATGTRWSPTLLTQKAPELKRTKSTDHAPTTPRASWTDLKNFQGMKKEEAAAPSANTRWSSTPKPASRSSPPKNRHTPSMTSLTRTRSRGGKRESAPDLLISRRLSHAVSPNEDDSSNGKNARWTSSPGQGATNAFHLSCSDLSLSQQLKRPSLRGSLNRWDSCSNFTVETLTSIDQLSTKPKLPKRRNRRRESSKNKRESSPSSQPTNKEEQVEALEEEPQDKQTGVDTMSNEAHSSVVSSSTCSSVEETKESTEVEEPQETLPMVHSSTEEPTTPKDFDTLQAEEHSEVEDDSSINELELGYEMPCFECFATIPEEEEANDEESIPGPPSALEAQISDKLLRAPKRRKSMNPFDLHEDEPEAETEDEQSISLNDTSSIISFSRQTDCTAASDCLSHSGHKRRAPEPRVLVASYMPHQPRRRESLGGFSLGSHSSAESGDQQTNDHHIRHGHRPTCTRRRHTTAGDTQPRTIRRQRTRESKGGEKHPLWDLNDTNAPTMTGASLRKTSCLDVFPTMQEPTCTGQTQATANNPAA